MLDYSVQYSDNGLTVQTKFSSQESSVSLFYSFLSDGDKNINPAL